MADREMDNMSMAGASFGSSARPLLRISLFAAIRSIVFYYFDYLTAGSAIQLPFMFIKFLSSVKGWGLSTSLSYALAVLLTIPRTFIPLSTSKVVSIYQLGHNVMPALIRYCKSETLEVTLGLFTSGMVDGLSYIGVTILLNGPASLWNFLVTVLFRWYTLLMAFCGSIFLAVRGPAAVFEVTWMAASLCTKPLTNLAAKIAGIDAAFIEKHESPLKKYEYRSIGQREIRLLKLRRSKPLAELSCSLHSVFLDTTPEYEAVSYSHGDFIPNIGLLVDGCRLDITLEVYQMLRYRQSFLGETPFWTDAICINQHDNNEKSQQVAIIDQIFSRASRVIAWLASPDQVPNSFIIVGTLYQLVSAKFHLSNSSEDFARQFSMNPPTGLHKLGEFFTHRWFSRLGAIQEAAVAKTLHVMFGRVCIDWALLGIALNILCDSAIINPFGVADVSPTLGDTIERQTLLDNARLINLYREPGKLLSLARALLIFRNFDSTAPSDRAFALQGITTQPQKISDYNKPFYKVYYEATCAIFSEENPFIVLLLAGIGFPRFEDLSEDDIPPSWVPDLRHSKKICKVMGDIDYIVAPIESQIRALTTDAWRTIKLEGIHVDAFDKMGTVYKFPTKSNDFLENNQADFDFMQGAINWYIPGGQSNYSGRVSESVLRNNAGKIRAP